MWFQFIGKKTSKYYKSTDQHHYFVILYDWMFSTDFFIGNNLISKNQSGFRQGNPCVNQLLIITHDLFPPLDDSLEISAVVYIYI